jgi:hypothetical protein
MKVKDAVKKISEIHQKWEKHFAESKKQADKAIAKAGWMYWAAWNLQGILIAEKLAAEWKNIEKGAKSLKGVTSVEFLKLLKGTREQYVGWILGCDSTNRSTGTVSNLASDISQQAYKKVVGHSILDGDSLIAIIIEMEREPK